VELGNKLVPVVFWHAHKCPAHDDELDLLIHNLQVKAAEKEKIAPYQRYGLNSSVALRVLESARMDHTGREWRACSLVRTLCNFGYYNQSRSRVHQDSNYDDVSNAEAMGWVLLDAHTYVSCHGNVRTPMRLAHDGNYSYLRQLELLLLSL
jgi:hypothetical protein